MTIPSLVALFELIRKFISDDEKISKERFENLINPIYLKIVKIHTDYNSMFKFALEALPEKSESENDFATVRIYDDNLSCIGMKDVKIGSSEYLKNIKIVKILFDEDREKNDTKRTQAKEYSAKLLRKTDGSEEKRFCWSVLNYFLNRKSFLDAEAEERYRDLVIKEGPKILDTPSYLISHTINTITDAEIIKNRIYEVKSLLNDKFMDVTSAYFEIKIETFS